MYVACNSCGKGICEVRADYWKRLFFSLSGDHPAPDCPEWEESRWHGVKGVAA